MNDQLTRRLATLREPAPQGFVDTVLAATGVADRYVTRDSGLGTLYVAFNDRGVSALDIAEDDEGFETSFRERFGRPVVRTEDTPPSIARHLDRAIADGKPGKLPVDLDGLTEFQAAVLRKAAEIPAGEVRPYGWIAKEIGRPKAVRAVGSALAGNPVPVILPCHRVVRSDGTIGNYSLGGPHNKRTLLEEEGLDVDAYQELAGRGITVHASDTTKIFCHPTCRASRRITEPHRVEFRSPTEAMRAGYRPCKICRPAAVAA